MHILFTILFVLNADAAKVPLKRTYLEVIKQAEDLSLQKGRKKAQELLIEEARQEKDKKAKDALIKSLKTISEFFYTDKAQKTYELGQSKVKSKPEEAIRNFKEALELEPENTKILLSMARTYLLLGQCKEAAANSKDIETKDPFNEANSILYIQALTCSQEAEDLEQVVSSRELTNPRLMLYVNITLAQFYFFKSQFGEAFKYLQRAIKNDEQFPENYYWENQILEKMNKEGLESAKKYIKLCKSISKSDVLKYEYEPRLCQEQKEIEKKLEELVNSKKDGNE